MMRVQNKANWLPGSCRTDLWDLACQTKPIRGLGGQRPARACRAKQSQFAGLVPRSDLRSLVRQTKPICRRVRPGPKNCGVGKPTRQLQVAAD